MSEVTVFDVAQYILEKIGKVTTLKLQKLVYYSQAWSLVWDEKPLFKENFQAWANGPVCKKLYNCHRGCFEIDATHLTKRSLDKLDSEQKKTIDAVLKFYGKKTPHWLSMLTHKEKPWLDARVGIPDGENGNTIITKDSMLKYYSNLN